MTKNVVLLGNKDARDYAGVKTLYAFNALTEAGARAQVYDLHSSTQVPRVIDLSIFLPWVQSIDKAMAKFIPTLPGRKVLYTDNFHWYDQTCGNLMVDGIDLDSMFHVIGFASSENVQWWPKQKFEWWGALVDENLVQPRKPQDYIWVDEVWPREWSAGEFTAAEVLDLAIPEIKRIHNIRILSQAPKIHGPKDGKPWVPIKAEWVDEFVEQRVDHQQIIAAVSGARAFITSHHECLGLMQFEALVSGVPVVTSPSFSKIETFAAGSDCVAVWDWDKDEKEEWKNVVDPEVAAARMVKAVSEAMEFDRRVIRERAIARFGKKAWVDRINITS